MSAYSDWRAGGISTDEYRSICNREDEMEKRQLELDAAKERCYTCEGYDEENDFCEFGEKPLTCSCCN